MAAGQAMKWGRLTLLCLAMIPLAWVIAETINYLW
jgi:hypothetical protein